MKHLKPSIQEEYRYEDSDLNILDTFENPGVEEVTLECSEFTSLCPVTGQPDYYNVEIIYSPKEKCLESKSLKLYLGMYRQQGGFAEQLTKKIYDELFNILEPKELTVTLTSTPRGGISIEVKKSGRT